LISTSLAATSALLVAGVLSGCEKPSDPTPAAPAAVSAAPSAAKASAATDHDQIITTFYPTEYFASRISGGLIRVSCPVPADADPIFWKPSDADIARYQHADMIIINGAEYEKWVASASLPLTHIVDTAHPFDAQFLRFQGVTHSHGAAGAHTHTGVDGHTWMDPVQATTQAKEILSAMTRKWPEHERAFAANYAALEADLAKLDQRWQRLAPALKAARLYASHPAYGYPARRYGCTIANVTLPPDEPASEATWAELAAAVAKEPPSASGPRVMLFESTPLDATVQQLAAKHQMAAVVFSPCETLDPADRAKGEDFLSVMNANLDHLEHAATGAAKAPNPG
jgi:zinc transport system substrate-binding protein